VIVANTEGAGSDVQLWDQVARRVGEMTDPTS